MLVHHIHSKVLYPEHCLHHNYNSTLALIQLEYVLEQRKQPMESVNHAYQQTHFEQRDSVHKSAVNIKSKC